MGTVVHIRAVCNRCDWSRELGENEMPPHVCPVCTPIDEFPEPDPTPPAPKGEDARVEATPRPWTANLDSDHGDYVIWGPGPHEFVANMGTEGTVAFDVAKANALLIVEAVNSSAPLRKEIEELRAVEERWSVIGVESAKERDRLLTEVADLKAQVGKQWTCPDCAFSFSADHADETGGYSCPLCAEARLEAQVERQGHALRTRSDYNFRCDDCGAPHNLDTSIPSPIWNAICENRPGIPPGAAGIGMPEAGALCTLCIDERLQKAGLTCDVAEFYYGGTALRGRPYAESTGDVEYQGRKIVELRAEVDGLEAQLSAGRGREEKYKAALDKVLTAFTREGLMPLQAGYRVQMYVRAALAAHREK